MLIKNKKASFNFFIEDTLEVGIVLMGTEIKSIRKSKVQINDAYAQIKNGELFIYNMHIAQFEQGNQFNHDELRVRKLLAHKKEINKLLKILQLKGYTLIPLELYLKNSKCKIKLGIAKGKHNYDKRHALKEKQIKLETKRNLKGDL